MHTNRQSVSALDELHIQIIVDNETDSLSSPVQFPVDENMAAALRAAAAQLAKR